VTRPNQAVETPGIELVDVISFSAYMMQALFTDRGGNPIWFYDVGQGNFPHTVKLLPNGDIILNIVGVNNVLREVDLAGNTVREIDIPTLQQKTQAAGYDFLPTLFHHDVLPLANGHMIALVQTVKTFSNLAGYPGNTDVLGDALIDLDQNWNPVWSWNSFDYLDVNRHLNGLPDWTHSNAIVYSPSDGNLLLSMRHQSWIVKIDYNNGAGTGNVLWKLGYQGDFTLAQGPDPSLWFSCQHFPSLVTQNGQQTTLAVWDNGDNRVLDTSGTICGAVSGVACYSRSTVFQVDEGTLLANLQWSDSPGNFSIWGGSVNQLATGNIEFDMNAVAYPMNPAFAQAEVQEVTQTPNPQLVWKMDLSPTAYRAYRVPSLYPGVTWAN